MKLSVIIPVYKAEKTLEKCVKSIIMQPFDDMELWLIDDGSPDHSGELCDQLSATDRRINVIHKPNGGPSDARNAALDAATGDYIMCVDSDDYLTPDTIVPLMEYIEQNKDCDILEFGVEYIGSKRKRLTFTEHVYGSADEYWHDSVGWEHGYFCNKVIRRSLFDHNRFAKGRFFEDLLLLPDLMLENPTVHTTDRGCYCYKFNNEGTSANISAGFIKQLLYAEAEAKRKMHTTLVRKNGWKLYYKMLCRQVDIYRLSGEIILKWPGVRIVCWLHKKLAKH